jgi:hypothetical protein
MGVLRVARFQRLQRSIVHAGEGELDDGFAPLAASVDWWIPAKRRSLDGP